MITVKSYVISETYIKPFITSFRVGKQKHTGIFWGEKGASEGHGDRTQSLDNKKLCANGSIYSVLIGEDKYQGM